MISGLLDTAHYQLIKKWHSGLSAVVLFAGLVVGNPVYAQSRFGTIVGIVKDSTHGPLAGATITAAREDGSTIRSTISNSDGVYSFSDLLPGTYTVTAQAEGEPDFALPSLNVTIGRATRADIAVSVPPVAPAIKPDPSPVLSASAAAQPGSIKTDSAIPGSVPVSSGAAAPVTDTSHISTSLSSSGNSQATNVSSNNFWKRWAKGDPMNWRELASQSSKSVRDKNPVMIAKNTAPMNPLNKPIATVTDRPDPLIPHAGTPDPVVPEQAEQAPAAPTDKKKIDPFSDWDWTWLNGNSRTKESPLDSKYFTGEFRADTHYGVDFNQPKDDTMGGSSEVFRSSEVQVEQLSLGGDLHVGNVRGRLLTMFGMFATTTPRNDASPSRGQWDLANAYRYVSEAYGGYHFNVMHGINVDAGIFASYIGLFSYYNFDNWAYQPSYVSSNTPWFFNGVRVQIFPTAHLKIEPWFINGWQAYGRPNGRPGLGGQIRWTPKPWLNIVSNNYGLGRDAVGIPNRERIHTDDSVEVKYYDNPTRNLDKMAFTFTGDLGCEYGGGVTCHGGKAGPKQSFVGYMIYNRFWFHKDLYAMTLGGGAINNPGRYLVLLPPINGATAASGTSYFTENPGQPFKAWDSTATFDYMPQQFITFRGEFGYRHANVPYFTGRQGITPPGGNTGLPGSQVTLADGSTWNPDLRRSQPLLIFSIMVKF